jgi:hypothetical protein
MEAGMWVARIRSSVLLAFMLVLAGCWDLDPFGLASRNVAGPYSLEQWEDFRTYYLVTLGGTNALDDAVEQIGWNDRYILVGRTRFSDDRFGWMIVDAKRRSILGPFTDAEVARRPEVLGIHPIPAAEAWERLPGGPNAFGVLVLAALAAFIIVAVVRRRAAGAAPA